MKPFKVDPFLAKFILVMNIITSPIAFLIGYTGFSGPSPGWSDEILAAEFQNSKIDSSWIYRNRGSETQVILVNGEDYGLVFEEENRNLLIANITEYKTSKTKNSKFIELKLNGKSTTYKLWTYDKPKHSKNRLIFSSIVFLGWLALCFLIYKLNMLVPKIG